MSELEVKFRRKRMPETRTRIFIICPAMHHVSDGTRQTIEEYVIQKEKEGYEVYWPLRNAGQSGPVDFGFYFESGQALYKADEVHIWYDEKDCDFLFDLGMLFMASIIIGPKKKKVIIINNSELKDSNINNFKNTLLTFFQ